MQTSPAPIHRVTNDLLLARTDGLMLDLWQDWMTNWLIMYVLTWQLEAFRFLISASSHPCWLTGWLSGWLAYTVWCVRTLLERTRLSLYGSKAMSERLCLCARRCFLLCCMLGCFQFITCKYYQFTVSCDGITLYNIILLPVLWFVEYFPLVSVYNFSLNFLWCFHFSSKVFHVIIHCHYLNVFFAQLDFENGILFCSRKIRHICQ